MATTGDPEEWKAAGRKALAAAADCPELPHAVLRVAGGDTVLSRAIAQLKAAIREAEGVLTEGDFAEARKAPREEHAEARAVLSAALQSNDGEALQQALDEGVRGGLPNDKLEAAKPCQEVSLGEGMTTVQERLHGLVSPEVSPEEAVTTAQVGAVALPP